MTKRFASTPAGKWILLLSAIMACVLLLLLLYRPVMKQIYPIRYESIVTDQAEMHQLPPSLIYAIIHTESKFDRFALSSANARGLMQITEDTYQWVCQRTGTEFLEVDSLYEPYENIQCGVALIRLLYERFDNTETMLAAYNAGQGKVSEWLKNPVYSDDGTTLSHIPYEETADYVHRVINTQIQYQKLYNIP